MTSITAKETTEMVSLFSLMRTGHQKVAFFWLKMFFYIEFSGKSKLTLIFTTETRRQFRGRDNSTTMFPLAN